MRIKMRLILSTANILTMFWKAKKKNLRCQKILLY